MHWFAGLFVLLLVASTLTRSWLNQRQVAAVQRHRDEVPEAFRAQIDLAAHQKAADYTVASAQIGRWDNLLDAALALLLTLGGGLSAIDRAWQAAHLPAVWHGTAVVLSTFLLVSLIGLPLSLWRTFGVEARFGFNRTTVGLFIADLFKGLLLGLVLGGPLVFVILFLMQRAGTSVVAVCLVRVGGVHGADHLGMADADRAAVQQVHAAERRSAQAAHRSPAPALRLLVARRLRDGRLAALGARQRLFHRSRAQQAHRILRHVARTSADRRGRSGARARARPLPPAPRALAPGAVAGLRARSAWPCSASWRSGPISIGRSASRRPPPHAALLLFVFVLPVFTYFTTPLGAWWSRKHEFEADEFAAQFADARQLAEALVKLYRDNATTLTPDRLHSAFYDSHPPALVRISRLQQLAART